MSWRDVLGTANPSDTSCAQNPHNTQNRGGGSNSADTADTAEADSRLLEVLGSATRELPISAAEVRDALDPEEIDEWRNGQIATNALSAFAQSLVDRRQMNEGRVPVHYTEHATCGRCGPIWFWISGEVSGCPWCWNRVAGRPIPRPQPVFCRDCAHFERLEHPHLGRCTKGRPGGAVGLWDTDERYCEVHLPSAEPELIFD
jgi:hypothetical protein